MKRVCLVCMKDDRDKLLESLQKFGNAELCESDSGVDSGSAEHANAQRRLEALIKELTPYTAKKPMLSQKPEYSEDEMYRLDGDWSAVEAAEADISRLNILEKAIDQKKALVSSVKDWEGLNYPLEDIHDGKYICIMLATVPTVAKSRIGEVIQDIGAYETVYENPSKTGIVLTVLKESFNERSTDIKALGFERVTLPIESGTVKEFINAHFELIEKNENEVKEIKQRLASLSKEHSDVFKLALEKERAASERDSVKLISTRETLFFKGWVPEKYSEDFEKAIKQDVPISDITFSDPTDEDDVPTFLENGRITSQFEGITNMFDPPSYKKSFDPNPVMAPWYWLIFGMMMGDAGYGVLLALLIILAKSFMKPTGGTLQLMNVMLYSSVTTVIFGVLFGSYFGEELLPPLIGFTSMGDPIKMLIFTIVIGVLHIFTGIITKMYILIRDGQWLDAIFDNFSWMMIISGIGMIFIPRLDKIGMILAIAGAVIILFTAGRHKKGIIGKATGGLLGLYDITSYFSDILSYSRILALGLATGVVGFVMNMLAEMVQGSVIGFILSLVIYAVGHLFNLALGLLSAYVHDCRLQYIEFYSKFYDGGGKLFRPFKIKTSYINIKK